MSTIEIYGDPNLLRERYGLNGLFSESGVQFDWIQDASESGIESVTFLTQNGSVRVD